MEEREHRIEIITLKDIMPKGFINGGYNNTKSYTMKDEIVIKEHSQFIDQDEYIKWPGSHKNIHLWVELENGYAVGFNENPKKGWSFPVLKLYF